MNPYGHSKLICEQMLREHAAAYGLRYAILRYFNVAGADPEGVPRERHDPETHLVPLAILAAVGRGPALRESRESLPRHWPPQRDSQRKNRCRQPVPNGIKP